MNKLLRLSLGALLVGGCNLLDDEPPPPPPLPTAPPSVTPTAPGVPPTTPTPTPTGETPTPTVPVAAGDQACHVGRWEAVDFLHIVRSQVRRHAAGNQAQLTRAGGTIHVEIDPVAAGGVGEVRFIADELRHSARVNTLGLTFTGTHRMNGTAKHPYRLPGGDLLLIETASESDLVATVNVQGSGGFGNFDQGNRPDSELAGDYHYECNGDELRVWESRNGQRRGSGVNFERVTAP